jgi:hypothetical protein
MKKKQDLADWFEEFSERVEEKMSKECPWEDGEQRGWFMDGVQKALDEVAEDIESGRIKTRGKIREYAKQRAKDLDDALIELDDYCGEQAYVELDGKYTAFLKMSGKKLYKFLEEKRWKRERWKSTGSR